MCSLPTVTGSVRRVYKICSVTGVESSLYLPESKVEHVHSLLWVYSKLHNGQHFKRPKMSAAHLSVKEICKRVHTAHLLSQYVAKDGHRKCCSLDLQIMQHTCTCSPGNHIQVHYGRYVLNQSCLSQC